MRSKIIAGNWKMNLKVDEALQLAVALVKQHPDLPEGVKVMLAPPFSYLYPIREVLRGLPGFFIGAQNCHAEDFGAFTGEISVPMLKSLGVQYVITGHSERREFFYENDKLIGKKIDNILVHNLVPVYCCGEPLEVRESNDHVQHVKKQVEQALFHLTADEISKIVIAYEPVWAIGTGKTATAEQAQEMHEAIRSFITKEYNEEVSSKIPILYGGSVKPTNAKELMEMPDIDGALVGGASLKAKDFGAIINSVLK